MRHLDLFSGIGGFALAASRTWGEQYKNVGHCEIEEYACKVYHKHFPDSKCLGDITKVKWNEGQADIITGGFPCQPHSQAGKRLASKDERDLWYECKRAVSEIRPRYALFENVAGLLTSERGGFFNRVLSDLAEIGYDAEWHNIPASKLGAPHRRERIWIIAYGKENRQQGIIEQWENNRISGGGVWTNVRPKDGMKFGASLNEVVKNIHLLPTPRVFMHKDSLTNRGKSNLGEVYGEKIGLRLQPPFVEWMMGYPINWTKRQES